MVLYWVNYRKLAKMSRLLCGQRERFWAQIGILCLLVRFAIRDKLLVLLDRHTAGSAFRGLDM
jgi:hypothetical protein